MSDCWLTLEDDLVSRYHARLHVSKGLLDVEDLGSRNGTFVNGKRLTGRAKLENSDQVRIGREVIAVLGPLAIEKKNGAEEPLRRTMGPSEEAHFPSLIGQLVEKSLSMGKFKEAERYAMALTNQLMGSHVPGDHPTAVSCVQCLVRLAVASASGVWLDRVFRLHAVHRWKMQGSVLAEIRHALDRIPRVPGTGISDYETALHSMVKEGSDVDPSIVSAVAKLADAYG